MNEIFATSARSFGWFLHAHDLGLTLNGGGRMEVTAKMGAGREGEEEEAAVPFYVVAAVFSIPFHIT